MYIVPLDMPSAALRPCATCGCGALVQKGHCVQHSKAREQARGSRHARGYTNRWAAYSKARLAKHPLCVGYPVGIHTTPVLATCTNHILSAYSHPELFWVESNHNSMCDACNKRQAIDKEGGLGR